MKFIIYQNDIPGLLQEFHVFLTLMPIGISKNTTTTLADIKKTFYCLTKEKRQKRIESTKNTLNSVSNKRTKDL